MSGTRIPVSGEEQAMLDKVGKNGILIKDLTDERQQELAHQMMLRGLLNKKRDKDNNLVYRQNSINDIWIGRKF